MKRLAQALIALLLAACAASPQGPIKVDPQILAGLYRPAERPVAPIDTFEPTCAAVMPLVGKAAQFTPA